MGQAESQQNDNYDGLYNSVQHIDYENVQSIDQMEKNLTMIRRLQQDPAYGDIKVLQRNKQDSLFAGKSYVVTKDDDFEKIVKKAKVMSQIQSYYVAKIRGFYKQMQEDFCSKYIKSVLLFDYYKDNMQKKIIHRKQFDLFFREVDIYYFIYNIVQGLRDLYSAGFIHGDIRPKTILLGNDGKYKLTEVNFMGTTTSYRNFLLGGKGSCYLSPELLQALKNRDINPDHDPFKSDIFSVGLICIEMATLSNINNCYDFKNFTADYEKLSELLLQISKSHSENLVSIITGMVNVNPDYRWDDQRIFQKLQPFQKDLEYINCSPVRENLASQSGDNIPNSLFNTQQQQFTTNENIDDVEEFKDQPNSIQNSRHNETEVKHPNQYEQKIQHQLESEQRLDTSPNDNVNEHDNNNIHEQDNEDSDIEAPCDEDEFHQSPEKHLPVNQSKQQYDEPSVSKKEKQQLEELIQSAKEPQQQQQQEDLPHENPLQKRLETQEDLQSQNNHQQQQQLPPQQPDVQSSCQMDQESIEERPKHAAHNNNYRSNNMIPSKQNLVESQNRVDDDDDDDDQNNDRFLQSPQKLGKSDRLNQIYSNNADEQELMQNLHQLDQLYNSTLSHNQEIKNKVSRLSLIPPNNNNGTINSDFKTNNGLATPGDQNRFSQYSPVLDDSQMFMKMNQNLSKIKDKLSSPQRDQLPMTQQDTVYESIDSNALYDLYMQEYQKIKSQRKSQQQLY